MKTKANYFFLIFLPSHPKWVVKMPKMVLHPINLKKNTLPRTTHPHIRNLSRKKNKQRKYEKNKKEKIKQDYRSK